MSQDELFEQAVAAHGPAIARLARACEADPARREDLLQEIHVQLWRSLAGYSGECSPRTWALRVAHNVCATHVLRSRRHRLAQMRGLDEIGQLPAGDNPLEASAREQALARLHALLGALPPVDAQLLSLYLEDLGPAGIADVTGLSPGAVATRIHRLKALLASAFHARGADHGKP